MDKKDKKAVEDAIKNSLMPGMSANPSTFLDAASLLGNIAIAKFSFYFNNAKFSSLLWQWKRCLLTFRWWHATGQPCIHECF
jgi:hypothetical protein